MSITPGTVNERTILVQLARVHARRYARHPLFLIGFGLTLAATIWDIVDNPNLDPNRQGGLNFYTAFLIGVLGLIVAYRLTRTEDRALALLPSAPTSPTTRTLALCAACLVPALAGALVLAVALIGRQVYPPSYLQTWLDAMPTADFIAWALASTMIAGLGGPLLGVVVGRWWRFPGAGVLAVIPLVVAVAQATDVFANGYPDSTDLLRRILLLVTPCVCGAQVTADKVPIVPWVSGTGSAVGQLVYTIGLCGLAVWAAVIKSAEGAERSRSWRNGVIAVAVAVGGLLWAIFG